MPISFACVNPKCKKVLKTKDEFAGKKLKCPDCGQVVQVPAPKQERVQASAAPPATVKLPPAPKQAAGKSASSGKAAPPPADLSDLEKNWVESQLLQRNEYQICPMVWQKGLNKLGPSYNLCPPGSKDVLGETHFRHTWTTAILKLLKLHSFVPHWIEVLDNDGTLFWMKVVKVVNNRYDIYDPARKEVLASLKTIFSLKLWLRILDPKGNDVGELVTGALPSPDGTATYYGFDLKLSDGRKIGDITNNANHLRRFNINAKGWLNRGYVGTVAPSFVNDPRTKVLVLATTLVSFLEGFGAMEFDPMSVK